MKSPAFHQPVGRDWFGLDSLVPGPAFIRRSARLILLEETESTSDFLRGRGSVAQGRICTWDGWGWKAGSLGPVEPLRSSDPGTIVVARRQTSGRGRQGRPWTDCGGLNLSLVIPPHEGAQRKGFSVWLGLMTTLVLREEFQVDVRLKWPNDLMVGEKKLGGILLERFGRGESRQVVAGLGLNVGAGLGDFPGALRSAATSLSMETGAHPRLGYLVGTIIGRVEEEIASFNDEGWEPYQHSLRLLDCLLGREVRLESGGRRYVGRSVGISADGALILETGTEGEPKNRLQFRAGDAHLLESGSGDEEEPAADREQAN